MRHKAFVSYAIASVVSHASPILDVTAPPYLAIGDNRTVNTASLQAAIDAAASAGGGVVLFPKEAGVFLSGALFMKSHVVLHISSGSVLQGVAPHAWLNAHSTHRENISSWIHFPPVYNPDLQQDIGGFQHAALINGGICEEVSDTPSAYGDQCKRWRKLQNVTVQGEGSALSVIDGGGWLWWSMCGYRTGQSGAGNGTCPDGAAQDSQRPKLMHFLWTNGLRVSNLWARNSAFFTVTPQYSDHIEIHDMQITAPASNEDFPGANSVFPSHNTDGVNIESCTNVSLQRLFINNGDDCVAIYSGSNLQGRVLNRTTRSIFVKDVVCGHGHGFAVGSRTAAGISNVLFKNISCVNSWRCVRLKSCRGRGGVVHDIRYEDIAAWNVGTVVHMDLMYVHAARTNWSATPIFRNITVRNLQASLAIEAIMVRGLPESQPQLSFDNVRIVSKTGSVTCENAACLFSNVSVGSSDLQTLIM